MSENTAQESSTYKTNLKEVPVTTASAYMSFPDLEVPDIPSHVVNGGVITTIMSLLGGILWIRKRISKDNLEVAKDDAERQLLIAAIKEKDKALAAAEEAWSSRTRDAKLIGVLSSDVSHLTKVNKSMTQEIARLSRVNEALLMEVGGLRSEVRELKNLVLKEKIYNERNSHIKK